MVTILSDSAVLALIWTMQHHHSHKHNKGALSGASVEPSNSDVSN